MTRNRRTPRILGQSLLALTMGSAVAFAQAPGVPPPISHQRWLQLQNNPEAMSNLEPYPAPAVSPGRARTVMGA